MNKNIKKIKLNELTTDPNNANRGTPRGRGLLERSLTELGAGRSILVDKNNIAIAGNKTLETAVESGFTDAVVVETTGENLVVVKRTDLDLSVDEKAKQLAIADNRVGEVSLNWDAEVLLDLEQTVDLSGYFSEDEIQLILDNNESEDLKKEEDENAIAQLQEKAGKGEVETRIKPGEIWKLGRHYVACADCTIKSNVDYSLKIAGIEEIELLFTSPPYSDMREYKEGTDVSLEKITQFIPAWAELVNYMAVNLGLKFKDGAVVPYWDEYLRVARDCGLKLLGWNVWDKQQGGSIASACNMFMLVHEWIFVFGESRKRLNRTIPNQFDKYQSIHGKDFLLNGAKSSVRKASGEVTTITSKAYTHHQLHSVVQCYPDYSKICENHPAVFPINLPTQYIEAMTMPGDAIADPFLGSGTTLIAAEQIGDRTCIGFELSPEYCEVIIQRWELLTGGTAEMAGKIDDH